MNVFNADLGLVITRLALLLGLGWFLARQGWVVPASRQSLMRLVIWVFFPAMIFDRVCGNPLINSGTTALLYLGVGFGMIVAGILVGRLVAQALALPGDVCRRTFAFASGTNNFGYLGIPITAALALKCCDRGVTGAEAKCRDCVNGDAVSLLGHCQVARTHTSLNMNNRHAVVLRGKCAGQCGVGIAKHQDRLRACLRNRRRDRASHLCESGLTNKVAWLG